MNHSSAAFPFPLASFVSPGSSTTRRSIGSSSSSSSLVINGSLHPTMLHYCHLLGYTATSFPYMLLMTLVLLRNEIPFPSSWFNWATTFSNFNSLLVSISTLDILLWLTYFRQLISTRSIVSIALHRLHKPAGCFPMLKGVPFKEQWPVLILFIIIPSGLLIPLSCNSNCILYSYLLPHYSTPFFIMYYFPN